MPDRKTDTTLVLPALTVPGHRLATPAGALNLPAHDIAEKRIDADPEVLAKLVQAAREAAQRAYAPFSKFHVGAALVMADDPAGTVFTGANVENSSYGGTICAERTAITQAAAQGFRRIGVLAVSCADARDAPLPDRSPCGLCRQVIKEFTDPDVGADTALILVDTAAPDTLADVLDIERLLAYGFHFGPPAN
ncbi:MAG: cytidine deaminase [Alphaproteobacteria bacterium]